mgnify:CR=1 FL=1
MVRLIFLLIILFLTCSLFRLEANFSTGGLFHLEVVDSIKGEDVDGGWLSQNGSSFYFDLYLHDKGDFYFDSLKDKRLYQIVASFDNQQTAFRPFYYDGKNGMIKINNVFYWSNHKTSGWEKTPFRSLSFQFNGKHGIFAATLQQDVDLQKPSSLFVTHDGGESWNEIVNTIKLDTVDAICVTGNKLIVVAGYYEQRDVYEHTQVIYSYDMTKDSGGFEILVDLSNPRTPGRNPGITVDAIFYDGSSNFWISSIREFGLFKSDDNGISWTEVNSIPGPDRGAEAIVFSDDKYGIITGNSTGRIYTTKDGGKSWKMLHHSDLSSRVLEQYFGQNGRENGSRYLAFLRLLEK